MFFQCPFSFQLWHSWWGVWKHPCVHALSLVDFWIRWGKPPTLVPFLQIVWSIGPTFILWQIWLERNQRIFRGENLAISQVWHRIMGMIHETLEAKCEVMFPLDKEDDDIMERLGLKGLSSSFVCVRRGRRAKKKVQREGRWLLPPEDILKINTDGSSRSNPGPVGIGGVGRDMMGKVVFFFSIHQGQHANNFMEGLAILRALEQDFALGWRKVICESDSQIIVNMLIVKKVIGLN